MEPAPKILVTGNPAPGWRCARCWKVLPEVGLVPEAENACLRCVDVLVRQHALSVETLDIHVLSARRFDRYMEEAREIGLEGLDAIKYAGWKNSGKTEKQ